MGQKLSDQAKVYSKRALNAKRKADETSNPTLRAGFLEMERGWLLLASDCNNANNRTDRAAAILDCQQEFEPQLQKLIHERNVNVLFESMWLASIIESSGDAIFSENLNGVITSWNRSAERLFGYVAEEVIGKSVTVIIPTGLRHEAGMFLGRIQRGERVEQYETVRRRKDGSLIDISLTVSPMRSAGGSVVGASKIARDITARKCAENVVQRQADLLDQSHDAILTWKIGGGITYWSRGAEDLYGYTSKQAIGRVSHELLRTRTHIPMQDVEVLIAQKGSWYGELTHITRDGREIVVESRLVRVNYDGDLYTLETNRDITARKHAEERVDLLIREANHRVKNILCVVQAIARQTAAPEAQDFIDCFTERIQALAANQDLLVRHKWRRIDLSDLVRVQLAHFADLLGSRIRLKGPTMHLNEAASQAIGLALHELATNAGKYGALSTNAGRVAVSWQLNDDAFAMSWIESNGPPVNPPERSGFGGTVTGPMVERTLGGKVKLHYTLSGLEWRLTCRAADALERRSG
jgi:PAS domain S-box-containing protein